MADPEQPVEAEGRSDAAEGKPLARSLEALAANTSRRGFLGRLGGAIVAATAGGVVAKAIKPGDAEAYHFCGHTFTTDSCPHPYNTGLPRIDRKGYPLTPGGSPVDNLGRIVNGRGEPLDDDGEVLRDPDGRPLPPAPRTKVCQDGVRRKYGFKTWVDGSWYRCCDGQVRQLADCCAYNGRRINGDQALTGYCFRGRKVFCVMYIETNVPC